MLKASWLFDYFRSVFEDKLSGLEKLNGVELTAGQFNLPRSRYELMCHGQLQQHLQLVQAYEAALWFVFVCSTATCINIFSHPMFTNGLNI